ncbi:Gram-negative bacterial tonB protein [compost metagenome]|uniref:energy transducer TonB n=1 Tax=Pedobacter ghigonis TaxID=2730403 RepID=UPI000F979BE2|nr:energy transducer TonB [Pedobacter ghigonis]
MKKTLITFYLLILTLCSLAQKKNEFVGVTGHIFLDGKNTLKNSSIRLLGLRDRKSGINEDGTYYLLVPKNMDVFVIADEKYVTKINAKDKNVDVFFFSGEKDLTKQYLNEWNKTKTFFDNVYKSLPPEEDSNIIGSPRVDIAIPNTATKNTPVDFGNKVFDFISLDSQPEYPKGYTEWNNYIKTNLKYPKESEAKNIKGTVIMSLIVEKDGSFSDIKVKKGLDIYCDNEAKRLLTSSEKWKPGVFQGSKVRTQLDIAIKFN